MQFIDLYTESLKRKYFFVVFLFFSTFSIFSYLLYNYMEEQKSLSPTINLASKQKYLNNQAYSTLNRYVTYLNQTDEMSLKEIIHELKDNQEKLISKNSSINLKLKDANILIDEYLKLYELFLLTNNEDLLNQINDKYQFINNLFDKNTLLFVNHLDSSLSKVEFGIIITTIIFFIITLLATYLMVFPTIKRIYEQDSLLKNLNSQLNNDLKLKIEQLKKANELAKLGVWEYHISKNELIWSKEIYTIFEIDNSNNTSLELFMDKVHPSDKEMVQISYAKHLETKEPYETKHRLLLENGRVKWVIEKCNTTFDDEGKPLVSIGIVQDITLEEENKQKELTILSQAKMASMGEMIGNIAHQWRQPLSSINTAMMKLRTKVQLEQLKKEELIETTKRVSSYTAYLSQTIDTFTNYIKNKKVEIVSPIENEIKQALTIAGTVIKDNDINLIENIDFSKENSIKMTTGELAEVLINILNNGKDALLDKIDLEEKWIKIDLNSNEKELIITIEDNAGGIPENIIGNIFESYFTTKDNKKGTGLGLYICKKIINESFNGMISVSNSPNGALFKINIPKSI